MTNNYSCNLDFIAHAGKGHDDNPPGRGSGRYAWGSGAKWGKAVNTVKGFFKKKKPVENRIETSTAKREVSSTVKNEISSTAKTEITPEQREANRKAALESGDRKQILKYFKESSNDELIRAINKAGLMDNLNKSISDSKSKTTPSKEAAKRQKESYIQEALWSGDYARIMSVASDKSISNKDLENALDKARLTKQVNRQLNPTALDKADRVFSALNKGLSYYNTAAPVWNIVAGVYNGGTGVKSGNSKPLPMLPIPKQQPQQPQQPQQQKQKQQPNPITISNTLSIPIR